MVDLSVKIGDITLQNPVHAGVRRLLLGIQRRHRSQPARRPGGQDHLPRAAAGQSDAAHGGDRGRHHPVDRAARERHRILHRPHRARNTRSFTPPLIVSVSSDNVEDFAALAEELSVPDVDVIEANISCPTRNLTGRQLRDARGLHARLHHRDPRQDQEAAVGEALAQCRRHRLDRARPPKTAGADCLVIANTFLSLKIRTDNFRPALGNKFGGLVSPALKPIVLRMVYQVAKQVKIPIIGIGGVTKAEDVVEYMLAGASAVGIGYAGFRNPTALTTIIDDLEAWCDERGIKKVTELIGAVRDDDMETDTLVAASAGV